MLSNKYTHIALVALLSLSSHSVANVDDEGRIKGHGGSDRGDAVNTPAPAVSSNVSTQHSVQPNAKADEAANETTILGSECVPFVVAPFKTKSRGVLNAIKADVGILSSRRSHCRGSNEICKADESSPLGGRCVDKSNAATSVGEECVVPFDHFKAKNKKRDVLKSIKADVGVLSSKRNTICKGFNQVCKRDASSSLGGRCVEQSITATSLGSECIPFVPFKTKNKRQIGLNAIKADDGILSSNRNFICHRYNEVCEADSSSSLGGRCVKPSLSRQLAEIDDGLLAACTAKCPTSKFCDCIYGELECNPTMIAAVCRNGDHLKCMEWNDSGLTNPVTYEISICPIYECFDTNGITNFGPEVQQEVYYNCMYCAPAKRSCDFCKENSLFSICTGIAEGCEESRVNQTMLYGPNCTAYLGDNALNNGTTVSPDLGTNDGPPSQDYSTPWSTEEAFASCIAKCPDSMLCGCVYGYDTMDCENATVIAAICKSEDTSKCLQPYRQVYTNIFACPLYECFDNHDLLEYGIDNATPETRQDMYRCSVCAYYQPRCEFCIRNSSFPLCGNGYINELCEEMRVNQTMLYGPNCTAYFAENALSNGPTAGPSSVMDDEASSQDNATTLSEDENLASCIAKCPTSKICNCLYGQLSSELKCLHDISLMAAICRSGDHLKCMEPYYGTLYDIVFCPMYECLDTQGITNRSDPRVQQDVYNCNYCVPAKRSCDFCKETITFAPCIEQNEQCEKMKINQTILYSPNCTAYFGENALSNGPTASPFSVINTEPSNQDKPENLTSQSPTASPISTSKAPSNEDSPSSGAGNVKTYQFCTMVVALLVDVLKSFL